MTLTDCLSEYITNDSVPLLVDTNENSNTTADTITCSQLFGSGFEGGDFFQEVECTPSSCQQLMSSQSVIDVGQGSACVSDFDQDECASNGFT